MAQLAQSFVKSGPGVAGSNPTRAACNLSPSIGQITEYSVLIINIHKHSPRRKTSYYVAVPRDSGQASQETSSSYASLIVDTKGTKEPVYSKDAGRYAKACPESRGKATVS